MKIICMISLIAIPALSWANVDTGCAKVGASVYLDLADAIVHDLHIDRTTLHEKKTTVEVLDIFPVSKLFAEQMADTDYNKQTGLKLKKEDFFESYYTNGAKSITAKYTFTNKKGQRNVFIVSSLQNNDECSIRLNGYLTLSREF
ncbi:Shiga toxin A subunit [Pantoea sp. CCBC3-3-1]|uniref:Shiga toxin A subunit n=1 Tax=Pantoea sp. CCBC3-3-1 TaxID=2490851 RepID=UPI0011BF43A1|nr:Shiga toxin A subunit [Pantoea sp. CCBC3-3-1]